MPSALSRFFGVRPRVLRGAAARVDVSDEPSVRRALAMRKDWQNLAWDFYDSVGELKFAVNFLANAVARLRLFVAEPSAEPGGSPEPVEDAVSVGLLDRLRGPTGSHEELLRELALQLSVIGDCWLVGLQARDKSPERWFVASLDELRRDGSEVVVRSAHLPMDEPKITLSEQDFWARIWRRHPRRSDEADSSVRGVLASAEELVTLDLAARAIARNRIATGSIVAIPDDMTLGNADPSTEGAGDGEGASDPLLQDIMEAFVTPTEKPGTAGAVAPYLLRYPVRDGRGQDGKPSSGIEHIRIDRPFDEMIDKRTDRALRRLGQGMDLPVEFIFGLGDANHWGAGQIEEAAFREHIEPLAVLIVNALTEVYLQPEATRLGLGPRLVWYDASALVVRTDLQGAADFGHKALILSDAAWRRIRGVAEDDAPSAEEVEQRIRIAQALAAPQAVGVPDLNGNGTSDEPGPVDQTQEPEEGPPIVAAAKRRGLGAELADLDRTLRFRTWEAADAALSRAVERAESRIVSKARRSSALRAAMKGAAPGSLVAVLGGPAALSGLSLTADELVSGSFEALASQFERRAGVVWEAVVERMGLPEPRSVAEVREGKRLAGEAAAWLDREMTKLAARHLVSPAPLAETGEADIDVAVPFGIVREAVSRAGGNAPDQADSSGLVAAPRFLSWLARGIGTGLRALGLLEREAAEPVTVEGWRWVYGPFPRRPFRPHLRLDGESFVDFEDDVLASFGWPGPFFFPGDHDGCQCDVEPDLVEVESEEQPLAAAMTGGKT